ncbi:hypothetical protein CGERO_10250 [Corynebacterium gerontici]|uniref:Uncharacterized protein n=1 Tax=Corynebacterium gerontici TaxID=2079234 RepID=A0A3G6J8I6_9CORY|nr:hypothetical protein CGERO_10250 [Corynebacterium gerontici]
MWRVHFPMTINAQSPILAANDTGKCTLRAPATPVPATCVHFPMAINTKSPILAANDMGNDPSQHREPSPILSQRALSHGNQLTNQNS